MLAFLITVSSSKSSAGNPGMPSNTLRVSIMLSRPLRVVGLTLLLLSGFVSIPCAQTKADKLHVATRQLKPFVFEQNGRLTGFSIELWHEIAKQLQLESEFVIKPTVADLLAALKKAEAEVGIAAISITAEREKEWDFSQPMFDSGLEILVRAEASNTGLIANIMSGVFSGAVLPIIGLMLLIILIPAHLVWLFERRNSTGMLAHKSYLPAIFEACWWAASTLATQADQMPRAALARVVAVLWMFASVVFVAYFTATVTSSLTVQQLRGDIRGPDDLPGKRIGSVKGSTSVEYLRQRNVEVTEFSKIEDAYEALEHRDLEAIVYDAPVLLYHAAHDGKGKAQVVGSIFRKENYGIAFPANSRLRKPVNEALLKLKENGTYDQLYRRWFTGDG